MQIALRGRFLVGSRPVSDDLVRRFILSAAESGIDIFRLHDPLNDVENLVPAAAAVREAGGRLYAGAEPIAAAVYPVAASLNRVAAEVLCDALTGLDIEHGVDTARVWQASRFIDDHVTSQMPALPIPPRITLRTAFNRVPVGLVAD